MLTRYLLHRRDQLDHDASPSRTSERVLDVTGPACQFLEIMFGVLGVVPSANRAGLEFEIAGGRAPGEYILIREDTDTDELEQAKQHYRNTDAALREAHAQIEKLEADLAQQKMGAESLSRALQQRIDQDRAGRLGDPDE